MSEQVAADEISLVDLLGILVKRKKWVLLSWLVIVVLSIGYLLNAKPLYESRAVIKIGHYPVLTLSNSPEQRTILNNNSLFEYKNIEQPYIVAERLEGMFFDTKPSWTKKLPDLVTITTRGYDTREILQNITKAVEFVLEEHRGKYDKINSDLITQRHFLNESIIEINKKLVQLEKVFQSKNQKDSYTSTIILMKQSELFKQKILAENALSELVKSEMMLEPTIVIKQPFKAALPIKPNTKIVIIIAVVFGLFAGVLLAFIVEFLSNMRKQLKLMKLNS